MVYTSIDYFPPYICATGKRSLAGKRAPKTPVPMGFLAILGPCESGISPNPPGSLSLPDLWALALRAPRHSCPTKSPFHPPICYPDYPSWLCHHLPWFKTTTTTLILYLLCFIPFPAILYKENIAIGETSQVITSSHFSLLLSTSMSIPTPLTLINWKTNTIHIHISNNSSFPFISPHFSLSLRLSIEKQKQYKYINKAIQKI